MEGIKEHQWVSLNSSDGELAVSGYWEEGGGKREWAASVTPSFGEEPWDCSMP